MFLTPVKGRNHHLSNIYSVVCTSFQFRRMSKMLLFVKGIKPPLPDSELVELVESQLLVIFRREIYGGTKVTLKIYFILRAHAVANTCARSSITCARSS